MKNVELCSATARVTRGSAGLATQVHGAVTSVSGVAAATGGLLSGGLMEADTK